MGSNSTLRWIVRVLVTSIVLPCGWIAFRTWPRKLVPVHRNSATRVFLRDGHIGIAFSADSLVAEVGDYKTVVEGYLYFDFLRAQSLTSGRVLLCSESGTAAQKPRIFLQVQNDILTATPYLDSLVSDGLISHFSLHAWSRNELRACQQESTGVETTLGQPVSRRLHQIPDSMLIGPMSDFLMFKSSTDLRVLKRQEPIPHALTREQARVLANDILVVSRFYDLPVDYFLAIGAMENNYMSVRGDLDHAVWKRHAERGDFVLRRRRGRVLVRNYSLGVWQITRETLRYIEVLYLRDRKTRDYTTLPERLRPQEFHNPDDVQPESLTAYAGLYFCNLLQRFDGDVMKAAGAYNGGAGSPNIGYGKSVRDLGHYARRVIIHGSTMSSESFASLKLPTSNSETTPRSPGP